MPLTAPPMPTDVAELQRRLAAAEATLAKKQRITMKVSEKGAVSLYGLGRFPVTLYKEQWQAVFREAPAINAFITANDRLLKTKE